MCPTPEIVCALTGRRARMQPYLSSELASLEQPLLQLLQAFGPRAGLARGQGAQGPV